MSRRLRVNKKPLEMIPGVGPSIANDLERMGYSAVSDLVGQNPENMYNQLIEIEGRPVDRCFLYVFRCAVYYAETPNPDPDKLKWWNWKSG